MLSKLSLQRCPPFLSQLVLKPEEALRNGTLPSFPSLEPCKAEDVDVILDGTATRRSGDSSRVLQRLVVPSYGWWTWRRGMLPFLLVGPLPRGGPRVLHSLYASVRGASTSSTGSSNKDPHHPAHGSVSSSATSSEKSGNTSVGSGSDGSGSSPKATPSTSTSHSSGAASQSSTVSGSSSTATSGGSTSARRSSLAMRLKLKGKKKPRHRAISSIRLRRKMRHHTRSVAKTTGSRDVKGTRPPPAADRRKPWKGKQKVVEHKRRRQTAAAAAAAAAHSSPATSSSSALSGTAATSPASPSSRRSRQLSGAQRAGRGTDRRSVSASLNSSTKSSKAKPARLMGKKKKKLKLMKKKGSLQKKLSVCVLSSSYEGADSETAEVDNFVCTPAHYIKKENRHKYAFTDVSVEKKDAYRTIRELVSSQKYDVFFNLCDGGRDEKRAGVEVVSALEDLNTAFTGTDSRRFEPSKIDMKLLVRSSGVRVPNYALLKKVEGLAKRCCHLRFPVIVKHLTGYASVGIQKDNLCHNIQQLRTKVSSFIAQYHHALVEEFIVGREGTVLATSDPNSPGGVKVFRPLMFNFLTDSHDFAYFDRKWKLVMDSNSHSFLSPTDPAYPAIMDMACNAFHYILHGVGYGRVDFRIEEKTNEPVFLEINPNCGMWYHEKDGGDYADIMVVGDAHWTHERFFHAAVKQATRHQQVRKPWYLVSQDKNGTFTARATRTVPENHCLFGDMEDPVAVITKALFKLRGTKTSGSAEEDDPLSNTVGCVVMRADHRHGSTVTIRHSCEPNMQFIHGRTLMCATKRPINVGEELSIDYGTLRDKTMPPFTCTCGTKNCRSIIFATPSTSRSVEMKAMKKLLREKKQQWLREKAEREAEKILKKRGSAVAATATAASGSGPVPPHSSSNAGPGSSDPGSAEAVVAKDTHNSS